MWHHYKQPTKKIKSKSYPEIAHEVYLSKKYATITPIDLKFK